MGSHWPNMRQLEHQNKVIIMNDNPLNKIGIHKFTETKCNMYSCIAFWSRKKGDIVETGKFEWALWTRW